MRQERRVRTHLLNDTASVHLNGQVDDLALHDAGEHFLLDLVPVLEEFLDDIVAEDILHELDGVGFDLPEDLVLLVAIGSLELLLDEAGAVLVTAEFHDVVVDILDTCQLLQSRMMSGYYLELKPFVRFRA